MQRGAGFPQFEGDQVASEEGIRRPQTEKEPRGGGDSANHFAGYFYSLKVIVVVYGGLKSE